MLNPVPNTTEQWIELIANSELPAITSTAKLLDSFSNDDKSSLPKLSKAILHDQALSSCVLKVANNAEHKGLSKVTTISRATVVLGIQKVKNICLTSTLVDSLLTSNSLDSRVYEKLMQLMANSFYAAMLAKMMVPNYNDDTQEEVYLAALLYGIGETAFWSSGGKIADKLVEAPNIGSSDFKEYCENEIGTSFTALSKGLANIWNLSDLLIKALDQPESRTDEVKIIYFADKLSTSIAHPGDNEADYTKLLSSVAKIMNITVFQLKARIAQTREKAGKLLNSYGADVLIDFIKPLPKKIDFNKNICFAPLKEASKEKNLLTAFMNLTTLIKSSSNINEYLQTTLVDAITTFEFERCSFFMLSDDKVHVKSRFVFNRQAQIDPIKMSINIHKSDNAIGRVLSSKIPALINDYTQRHWRDIMTQELVEFIQEGSLVILPVKIGDKVIGVICAQYFSYHQSSDKSNVIKRKVSTDDFKQLCLLIEHLNLCLTMIMQRR